MLFETATIKPGNATGKMPNKPAQPVRNTANTAVKKAPLATNTSAARPAINFARQVIPPKTQIAATSTRQNMQKPAFYTSENSLKNRHSPVNRIAATQLPKKVHGWPTARQGIRKPAFPVSPLQGKRPGSFVNRVPPKTAQGVVEGWGKYHKTGQKPPLATAAYNARKRSTGTSFVQKPLRGWNKYRAAGYWKQGVRPATYSPGGIIQTNAGVPPYNTTPPTNTNNQRVPANWQGWPSNPNTTIAKGQFPPSRRQLPLPPLSKQVACRICGCGNNSCDKLSGFAVGSAQLSPTHIIQITVLAQKIIDGNIGSVIATGHTDASGSVNDNLLLGHNRAANVVHAVRVRMHKLKPFSQQNVFWKIMTKGKSQPVSSNNAFNRRVEVCINPKSF